MRTLNFNYTLTRSYRYPWLPWIVFLGGVCATSILTVINLAANGNVYVSDPNATLSSTAWYERKPWSLTNKVSPVCQAQPISQASQIFTKNHGIPYKIDGLRTGNGESLYSLAYLNNDLQNCKIDDFEAFWPKSNVAIDGVQITISCLLNIQQHGTVQVALVPLLDKDWYSLMSSKTQASTALGAAITMFYFYNQLHGPFSYTSFPLHGRDLWIIYPDTSWGKNGTHEPTDMGIVAFDKEDEASVGMTVQADSKAEWNSVFGLDMLAKNKTRFRNGNTGDPNNISDPFVSATISMDGYVKATISTILSDLGRNDAINIFTSPQRGLDFVNKTVQLAFGLDWENSSNWRRFVGWEHPYIAPSTPPTNVTAFYEWANMSLPHVETTQFSMQYLCQIPKLKSAGSLFISVAVADFVFLQVIWTIFNWIMTYFLERKHPDARYCVGCAKAVALGQLDLDDKPRPSFEEKDRCSSRHSESAGEPLVWSDTISVTSDATGRQSPSILRRRTDVNPYFSVPNG